MDSDFKPAKRQVKSVANKTPQLAPTKTPVTETFQTPEQIAADDDLRLDDQPVVDLDPIVATKTKLDWRSLAKLHWPPGKKEAIVAALLLVVIASGTALALTRQSSKTPVVATTKKTSKIAKAALKPATVASTLSGLPVTPEVNQRPVTGVMIENSIYARPQSGLGQAGVVFEAIAEGGITRFLALFQDTNPESVGPIRSARPYYAQWALGFDAGYAHVGGSPEALASIKAWGVRDLDQFANGGSYQRIASREAPHNVYTSIATLNQLEATKGYTKSTFTGFERKAEAPSKQPTAKSINLAISGPTYNAHYDYTAATNSYARSEGGAAHIDANTNTQISPKVVVALVMTYGLESDGYHSSYSTIGSGPVSIFQDGTVTTGQWSKPSATAQFSFTDSAGKPIKLNPGQTWLTAVSAASSVTYTP